MSEPVLLQPKLKFCKDCRHCVAPNGDLTLAKCHHPKIGVKVDSERMVTGVGKDDWYYCSSCRYTGATCGPEGTYWEPRNA